MSQELLPTVSAIAETLSDLHTLSSNSSMTALSPTVTKTAVPQSFQHDAISFINIYVLGVQIALGVCGNVLNLIVLLSKKMRSRTNLIFAVMAMADLFFLLSHIPVFLFFSGITRNSDVYRSIAHLFSGVCNWSSAVSIWCMTYATIERVQAFRSPFRATKRSVSPRFLVVIVAIVVVAFLITFAHFYPTKERNKVPAIQLLMVAHAVLVIVIPLMVCAALNLLLVLSLRRNTMPVHLLNDNSQLQQSIMTARSKNERKITMMVTVILTSFVVCNAPGAILAILRERNNSGLKTSITYTLLESLSNCLTVTGKVLNFGLFCLSSQHFREMLMARLAAFHLMGRRRRNSYRSASKTHSLPLNEI